jgi:hypothetical protein
LSFRVKRGILIVLPEGAALYQDDEDSSLRSE